MDSPSQELVVGWKQLYDEVFSVEAGGTLFVFRALTFDEYDSILNRIDENFTSVDVEDQIVKLGTLYPDGLNPDEYSPGVIASLADEIKDMSGFGEVYRSIQLLKDWRQKIGGVRGEMKCFILFAFPGYTSADLDGMTFYRFAELTALAEKVIYLRQISEGMEIQHPMQVQILTPEEVVERAKRQAEEAATVDPIAQRLISAR